MRPARHRGAQRLLAIIAGAAVVLALLVVLVRGGGNGGYEVTAEFQNASQLVGGEQVVVGGVPAGSVEKIALGDDNRALITFTVDQRFAPLREGTIATVRSASLAGLANRRLELTLPDEPGAPIADGGTLGEQRTVSEVDLDEVFNTLDPDAVKDLKRIIHGLDEAGRGVGGRANRGLRYMNPLLSTSRRVLAELNGDKRALERLIVDTSQLSGAVADRSPEISELVGNLNVVTGAVGRQRAALTAAIKGLPSFLREANTTFVNLRVAADDLEPLLAAAEPVADRLGPFFREFRAAARDAVPAIGDLRVAVRRPGADNDLVELTRLATPLGRVAAGTGSPECGDDPTADYEAAADDDFEQGALGEATCALGNSLPILAHLRPYTPELVGWFDDFSTSGTLDANGGIGRIAGTFNAFSLSPSNGLPDLLSPIDPAELFDATGTGALVDINNNARCPGSNERDPGDGSTPFTDSGRLDCDPSQVPVGP